MFSKERLKQLQSVLYHIYYQYKQVRAIFKYPYQTTSNNYERILVGWYLISTNLDTEV
jgi:hypothetical protein